MHSWRQFVKGKIAALREWKRERRNFERARVHIITVAWSYSSDKGSKKPYIFWEKYVWMKDGRVLITRTSAIRHLVFFLSAVSERFGLSTVNAACNEMNNTPRSCTLHILCIKYTLVLCIIRLYYRVHKNIPGLILSQMNPVHTCTP